MDNMNPMQFAARPFVDMFLSNREEYVKAFNAYNVDRQKADARLNAWVESIDTDDEEIPQVAEIKSIADTLCADNDIEALVSLYRQLSDAFTFVRGLVEVQHNRVRLGVTSLLEKDDETPTVSFDDLKVKFDTLKALADAVWNFVKLGILTEDDLKSSGVPLTVKERKVRNGSGEIKRVTVLDIPNLPRPRVIPAENSKTMRLVVDGVKDERPLGDAVRAHFGNEVKYEDLRKAFRKAMDANEGERPDVIEFKGKQVSFDVK